MGVIALFIPHVALSAPSVPSELTKDGFFSYYLTHMSFKKGASLEAYGKSALHEHGRERLMRVAFVAGNLLGTTKDQAYQKWNRILLDLANKAGDARYIAVANVNDAMYKSLAGDDTQISRLNNIIENTDDWFVKSIAYDEIGALRTFNHEASAGLAAFHEAKFLLKPNEQDSNYAYFIYESFYGSSVLYYNDTSGFESLARSILYYRPKNFPPFDQESIGDMVTAAFRRGDERLARQGVSALQKIAEATNSPDISGSAAIYCARTEYLFGAPAAVLKCLDRVNINTVEPRAFRIYALLMLAESQARLGRLDKAQAALDTLHQYEATGSFPKYAFDELPQVEATLLTAKGQGRKALDIATRFWRQTEWKRTIEAQSATRQLTKSLESDVSKLNDSAAKQRELIRSQWALAVIILTALLGAIWFTFRERKLNQALGEAKDRAESANLIKSQFLANVSHEVRTPLNGMLGMVQLIQMGPIGATHKDELEILSNSGASLLRILNDLLDIAKIEAGKLTIDVAPFHVEAIARESLSGYAGVALNKGLNLDLDIQPGAEGWVLGDSIRIQQILGNLISNALKFTAKGGVTLRIERVGEALQFAVRDTGVGLSPEALSRIFDKFEQADVSTSRRFGGTGLGLSICRELTDIMGGTIAAQSQLGVGTTFVVTLPLERTSCPVDAPPPSDNHAPPHRRDRRLRILVAEDHVVNQLVFRRLLEPFGCDVTIVEDGQSAVDRALCEDWDLILMDLQMPILDGEMALRKIRDFEAGRGEKARTVIAASASVMPEEIARYLDAGFSGILPKPIQVSALLTFLEQVTEPERSIELRAAS